MQARWSALTSTRFLSSRVLKRVEVNALHLSVRAGAGESSARLNRWLSRLAHGSHAPIFRPMSKERYIEAKQKWAEKQKARGVTARAVASKDRLPPGQKLTTGFPELDLGVQPEIPHDKWTLKLDGLVDQPATLSWAEFHALPQVDDVSDFHCVTTWSKYDCRWGGVAFTTL